jgi:squalene-associated FAD-dependent desaturase
VPERPGTSSGHRVVVVGGGLAGVRAALEAADRGAAVTLVERRRRIGGRTWSFHRHGLVMDNGQHVFMRCCTEYRAFVERIGGGDSIAMQRRLDVPVLSPGRRPSRLGRVNLPPPLHLAPSLAGYRHLTATEKASAVRAALRLGHVDPDAAATDTVRFGDWLAANGQRAHAVAGLWDLIGRPTMNVAATDASLALAAKVFRTGMLDTASGADLGWPLVPLSTLHDELPRRALDAAGVEVVTQAPVIAVARDGDGFAVTTEHGRRWDADAVVVAVPHQAVGRLLPPGALDGAEPARLGASPIVNVHLIYDRRVTDLPFAAAVGSPVQFLFDRTGTSGLRGPGQHLALSLSAADAEAGQRASALVATMTAAVAELLPPAGRAQLVDAMVTREPEATFRGLPATRRHRPSQATAVPGLAVAGAWTATGWPDTMEGAVRSGVAAARAALDRAAMPDAEGRAVA